MENISFNKEDSFFELTYMDSTYYFPYRLSVKDDFEQKDFSIYFFYKNNFTENDIFQVILKNKCDKDTRLGYIFPLNALASTSHKYSEHAPFLKYAFMAYKYVIKNINDRNLLKNDPVSEINIESLFEEDIFVFIHSKETIVGTHIDEFKIDNFIASFFLNGLILYEPGSTKRLKTNLKELPSDNEKINIYHMSDQLNNDMFILNLLRNVLPNKNDYIIDFFYCYQVFELLMDKVFKKEIQPMIEDIKSELTDSRKIIDIMHDIREITSEKSRISKIESDYLKSSLNISSLKTECENLLKKYNKEIKGEGLKDFFYSIRNLLFHQYRIIGASSELKELTEELNYLTCDLLINFECVMDEQDYAI